MAYNAPHNGRGVERNVRSRNRKWGGGRGVLHHHRNCTNNASHVGIERIAISPFQTLPSLFFPCRSRKPIPAHPVPQRAVTPRAWDSDSGHNWLQLAQIGTRQWRSRMFSAATDLGLAAVLPLLAAAWHVGRSGEVQGGVSLAVSDPASWRSGRAE